MDSKPAYHHHAFGLHLRSCLPLPELLPAEARAPDIEVSWGEVPSHLSDAIAQGARYQAAPGRLLLHVDHVARYLVSDGRTIAIAREAGADDDDVRAFLLTSVLGLLLQQRGDLVLHGSAIVTGDYAVGFLGPSGAGKSTLAAAFRRRGRAVLTDDLCVVRSLPDGLPAIQPSFPHMKLWLDSLRQLEIAPEGLRRVRNKLEKRALPLGREFAAAAKPLKKLYVLNPTNESGLSFNPIKGPLKFRTLRNQTYRFGLLAGEKEKLEHFQQAMKLAEQVPVVVVQRPEAPFNVEELMDRIEADLRA